VEYEDGDSNNDEYPKEHSLNMIDRRPFLPFWESNVFESCSSIYNSFQGSVFAKNLSKTDVLRIYRKSICRTMEFEYVHSSFRLGNEFYHYRPKVISDGECLCKDITCSLSGIGSMAPCYGGEKPMEIAFNIGFKWNLIF
jgi:CD36 family